MLLWILGILLLVIGIIAMFKGEVALSKTKIVRGAKARIIGVLMILAGVDPKEQTVFVTVIPLLGLLGLPILGILLGFSWAEPRE